MTGDPASEPAANASVRRLIIVPAALLLVAGLWFVGLPRTQGADLSGKIVFFGSRTMADPDASLIQAMNPGGTDLATVLEWRDGSINGGRVSPDGRRLGFSVRKDKGEPQVWILEPDGTTRQVADRGFIAAWSPDGNRLACFRTEGEDHDSFIIDVETGTTEHLSIPKTDVIHDWSPRGDTLTVMAGHPDRFFTHPEKGTYPLRQIDLMNLATGQRSPLTTEPAHDHIWSRFSPDGTRIAHYRRHPENVPRIYEFAVVRRADGSEPKDVIRFGDLDPEFRFRPNGPVCWSPDGKTILWKVTVRKPEDTDIRFDELVFVPADGGRPRRLPLDPKTHTFWGEIDWR
jgi:WD40 repeat protein